jgi:DHA3 family multidrug efflux protein-like MFS transporter
VLFTTLNNLFGRIAMATMDPYGIDKFGVEGWGFWFAVASAGFIAGGAIVAKRGIGKNPIRTILIVVVVIGAAGAVSTVREWA